MAYVQRIRHPFWGRHHDEVVEDRRVTPATGSYIQSVLSQIIWFVAGVITVLLAFRFVLTALAANPANGFVNFIYDVSHPLAAPFFGMFNYNDVYIRGTGSHFEVYTLLAMAVYLAAAWILSALVNIGRRY
ncbi:YggT family protein [Candidatus Saccharibacteria bacterium]|nr:YggT family protein [Candidatus Saccharibacteria bacterium]